MKLNRQICGWIFLLLFVLIFNQAERTEANIFKFQKKDGLLNRFTRYYFIDQEQRVWVATFGSGIRVFDGKNWTIFTKKNTQHEKSGPGLITDNVMAVSVDPQHEWAWAVTQSGICRMNLQTGKWQHLTGKNGPPVDFVRDLAIDERGHAFFASYKGVVEYTKDGHWIHHLKKDGLFDENVRQIRYAQGAIWAGTRAGAVSKLDSKSQKWITYIDY